MPRRVAKRCLAGGLTRTVFFARFSRVHRLQSSSSCAPAAFTMKAIRLVLIGLGSLVVAIVLWLQHDSTPTVAPQTRAAAMPGTPAKSEPRTGVAVHGPAGGCASPFNDIRSSAPGDGSHAWRARESGSSRRARTAGAPRVWHDACRSRPSLRLSAEPAAGMLSCADFLPRARVSAWRESAGRSCRLLPR